jgi:3-hydroxyisobutyrate dehydrogenase-like beta-hydroxyacid dehydrogenase
MGTAIAERLIDAGHDVHVWNRSPGRADALVARGATELEDAAGAWDVADLCITMLADSDALAQVALAADGGLAHDEAAKGKTFIDMSTVSSEVSAEVAEAAAASGIKYVRAPVSGNPGVVRAGNLAIVASGGEADIADAEPVLRDIGAQVYRAGEGEAARIVKLALNLMVAGTAELLAECVALAEAHGVDRATLLDVVSGSAVGSPFVKYKVGPLLADDYTATFTTRLMRKDLDLALAAATTAGATLPVTGLVRRLLQSAVDAGLGDLDFMALLIRLQREASGDATSVA